VTVCPTRALVEKDDSRKAWEAIHDLNKYVMAQTAPSIRVSLGESFGMPAGTQVTGKMTTTLRRIGFDKVLDTTFGADATVVYAFIMQIPSSNFRGYRKILFGRKC